jgi:hypothetical protein
LVHLCARGGVLDLAFPRDGAALQLVGGLELPGAEVPKVALEAAAVEEVGELVLELHPGLGVQQVERGGRAPAAAPEVEVLGGGDPRRGEHAEHVVRRRRGLGAVVVLVVAQHPADEAAEVGLRGGRVRGRRGAELGEVAGLLGDPGFEELGEGLRGRRGRGAAIAAAVSGWRRWGGGHGDRRGLRWWRMYHRLMAPVITMGGAPVYKGGPCRPLLWAPQYFPPPLCFFSNFYTPFVTFFIQFNFLLEKCALLRSFYEKCVRAVGNVPCKPWGSGTQKIFSRDVLVRCTAPCTTLGPWLLD